LQSLRPVRRVAELGSLIWLNNVKRTVRLLSESFHFLPVCLTAAFLIQKQEHFYGCSMLRYVSPLAGVAHSEVIHTARSDAALASHSRHLVRIGYRQ
jgi:hypothetical protein